MSLSNGGQQIICDGVGCNERAASPIALRPTLSQRNGKEAQAVDGWLFTASRGSICHYCPRHAAEYLKALSETENVRENAK